MSYRNVTALSKARTENTILKQKLADAVAQSAALTDTIESMKRANDWRETEKRRLQEQVDNMHSFLDAVPDSIGRTSPATSTYGSPTDNTPLTRLAAWLATGNRKQAF